MGWQGKGRKKMGGKWVANEGEENHRKMKRKGEWSKGRQENSRKGRGRVEKENK